MIIQVSGEHLNVPRHDKFSFGYWTFTLKHISRSRPGLLSVSSQLFHESNHRIPIAELCLTKSLSDMFQPIPRLFTQSLCPTAIGDMLDMTVYHHALAATKA
jgi:hypothetical protein